MKRTWVLGLSLVVLSAATALAETEKPFSEGREAMKRLNFLVGSWKGDAVMQMGPGAAQEASQTEKVESRLDGLLLVVEGMGKDKLATQTVVHHAVALISYDVAAKHYRVVAYKQDGQSVDATGKFLDDGRFQWGFAVAGRHLRYTISDLKGDWYETGEFSPDGTTWTRFFEMQLKREQ